MKYEGGKPESSHNSIVEPVKSVSNQEEKIGKSRANAGESMMNRSKIISYAERFIKKTKKSKRKLIEIDEDSRALYIFGHDNWLRVKLKILLENPYFEGFIYTIIAFNSLLLALEEPVLQDEYQKKTIELMLNIISIIFVVEFLLKIIVHGFVIGPKTYLKDNFNKLDFLIVFFSIVNWILE